MRIASPFRFPPEQEQLRARARRMAWITIGVLSLATLSLALTLGQSQAMKTAWVSDLLSLITPAALLVAMRIETRPPSKRFPYGYHRALSVAFLATAAALGVVGLWLLYDSILKLVRQERPPIGAFSLFGTQFDIWAGWPMIAALSFSIVAATVIGALKKPIAVKLHNKAMLADADMNKANYMSESAALVGIVLVGYGFWWGDAVAAALISSTIIYDGWHNMRQVIGDLMDESPTEIGAHELEDLPARIKERAERLPWVETAAVRLRESGHVLNGEVFVVPRDERDLVTRVEEASELLRQLDWRLHNLVVVPVSRIESTDPVGIHAERSTGDVTRPSPSSGSP
jgi:cation diffusion facilitator family transporter